MDAVNNFIITFLGAVVNLVVGHFLGALAIIVIGQFVIRALTRTMRMTAIRTRAKPALVDLSVAAVQGIGLLVILSGSLQALGLDQIALAVGGSISLIALGVASAASGNLGDIIAGVFLASDPDFGTGFTISTSDIVGTIEHVDLRKTRIRTPDGRLHVVPNKEVESHPWIVEQRPGPITPAPLFRGRGRPQAAPPAVTPPAQPPANQPLDPREPPPDSGATRINHPPAQ